MWSHNYNNCTSKSWFVLKYSNHQQLQISFSTGVVPDKELPGWKPKYYLTASERMLMKKGASINESAVGRSHQRDVQIKEPTALVHICTLVLLKKPNPSASIN